MKVLITGGAGFIGSHLAARFLQDGCSVTVLDDLSTGSLENISSLHQHPQFTFHTGTVLRKEAVADLVDASDIVYHLAAAVGVRLIVEHPVDTIRTNVVGTDVVLQAAARRKKRVVVASTSEVYGKSVEVPFREDADISIGPTTKGRWSYACAKALDEFLALAYWEENAVPVTVVRFFNIVGPRQVGRYGMVLPSFVGQALRNEPITVFGSGDQTRCFAYVLEAVECLVRIADARNVVGEVINVGNDQEVSIKELARVVNEICESSAGVIHVSYDRAYGRGFEDMQRRVPCLQKLERLLGYRPRMPLDQIVRLVANDVKRTLKPAAWTPAFAENGLAENLDGKPVRL